MRIQAFLVVSMLTGLLLAASGCAADSSPDEGAGDESDITKAKQCGGIAGIQCSPGTTCKLSSNHPDASGTCVKVGPGKEGGMCAGIAGIPCDKPLVCKVTDKFPDASGTCVKAAPTAGTKCGTATCASGDVCCDALHGTCTKPGQFCAL